MFAMVVLTDSFDGTKKINSTYKKQKHPFLHLRASCLEMGMATTSKININHILCQGSLCLKLRRFCQLKLKFTHRSHCNLSTTTVGFITSKLCVTQSITRLHGT